jgi:hypothetical protein
MQCIEEYGVSRWEGGSSAADDNLAHRYPAVGAGGLHGVQGATPSDGLRTGSHSVTSFLAYALADAK